MLGLNKKINTDSGFTIVELLVVIVVIGILASITLVSYAGITARANTAAAQSAAGNVVSKANVYYTDGPTITWPTSFGSLSGAASTASYYANSIDFSTASGNTVMAAAPAINDQVDFSLCGTASAAAATSYATITVPTGVKAGYWNFVSPGSLNTSSVAGSVSGTYTNGYNITCYKVGLAEAAVAVARAMYNESGTSSWPITAASVNANTALGAKLPVGLAVNITAPIAGTAITAVKYECASAAAGVGPCLPLIGGRIGYWDGAAVSYVTFGTGTNYFTPAS